MPLLTCDPSSLALCFTADLKDEEVVTLKLSNHDDGMSPGVCPAGWNGNIVWSLEPAARNTSKKYTIAPLCGILSKDGSVNVLVTRISGQNPRANDSFTLSIERTILTKAPESKQDWRLPTTTPVTVVLKQNPHAAEAKKSDAEAKKKAEARRKAKAKSDAVKKRENVAEARRISERREAQLLLDKSTPCLYYPRFAGRGELIRLIATVGELVIDEVADLEETAAFGSAGALPCLGHGGLKLAQSFAIERYIATIAPKFSGLTVEQRATDDMFCKIKEDMLRAFHNLLEAMMETEEKQVSAAEDVAALADQWFPLIEGLLPEDGFINGMDFPTAADLALLNIARGFMPFGGAYLMGSYDVHSSYPEFGAHVVRVEEYPAIEAYLESSLTLEADPLDLASGAPDNYEADGATEGRRRDSCVNQIDDDDLAERMLQMEELEAMANDPSSQTPRDEVRSQVASLAGDSVQKKEDQIGAPPEDQAKVYFWQRMFGSCCQSSASADLQDVKDAQAAISQVVDDNRLSTTT